MKIVYFKCNISMGKIHYNKSVMENICIKVTTFKNTKLSRSQGEKVQSLYSHNSLIATLNSREQRKYTEKRNWGRKYDQRCLHQIIDYGDQGSKHTHLQKEERREQYSQDLSNESASRFREPKYLKQHQHRD